MSDIHFVTASHDPAIRAANLEASPGLRDEALLVIPDAASAAQALNAGLDATTAEVVVFVHHDVWLPEGWTALLRQRLRELEAVDPDWALFSPFGVGLDARHIGPVWSSSLGQIVGQIGLGPVEVQSHDEMMIILRRSSGLRFDPDLPGWHLYGTDIVAEARARGLKAWAGGLPCLHNDRFHAALGDDFTECYQYLRKKWAGHLPLRSPITKISRSGLHLWRDRWRARGSRDWRAGMVVDNATPIEVLARACGWSDLRADLAPPPSDRG